MDFGGAAIAVLLGGGLIGVFFFFDLDWVSGRLLLCLFLFFFFFVIF